ncbi:GIY-YIG nuclease family protein [bacterium]|nr:GIY-YIG nuclease family protein [bacterium]MBQ9149680.1 GIY-YIG nuclease family protein [bacterium]
MADFKKTIKLFLMDYEPTGRIKCSIDGTICVAFKLNREDLEKSKDREELKQSGIYFLFGGTSDNSAKEVVYIGQASCRKNGEGLLNRLIEHGRNPEKDYWNEAVAFTTTDNSFGPTEISYLENYFCRLAKEANRYIVKNGNEPMTGNISEEKQCTLEEFVYNSNLILSALNYKVLVPLIEKSSQNEEDNYFYINRTNRKTGVTIIATGQKTRDGFVVLKGSYISGEDLKAIPEKIHQLRLSANIDKDRILQEDLLFASPSYAAAFVIGSNANGLREWKNKKGIPLKELEE